MLNISHLLCVTACGLLILLAAGCGSTDGNIPITGEVTFQGRPIAEGEIVFTPAAGTATGSALSGSAAASVAGKITGGKYTCRVSEGRSQVRITAYREVPGKVDRSNPGEEAPVVEMYIPPEYNANTKLEVTVDDSTDQHDFKLGSG